MDFVAQIDGLRARFHAAAGEEERLAIVREFVQTPELVRAARLDRSERRPIVTAYNACWFAMRAVVGERAMRGALVRA